MKPIINNIFLWYLFLTFLPVISATTINYLDLLSGILLMWSMFLIFFISSHINKLSVRVGRFNAKHVDLPLGLLSFLSLISSVYAALYYTGQSPFDVFLALISNISLYNSYQQYHKMNDIAVFSVSKVPAILSMLFVKATYMLGFFKVFIFSEKILRKDCIWLFFACISSMYFATARGTSFEYLEVLFVFWFSLTMRGWLYSNEISFFRIYLPLFILGLIFIFVYNYNISARYSFGEIDIGRCVTQQICLDSSDNLYLLLPGIAELTLKMSSYFTFGIFYTSTVIDSFYFENLESFAAILLPLGLVNEANGDFLCGDLIDCGSNWIPDSIRFLFGYGAFTLFLILFLLAVILRVYTSKLQNCINNGRFNLLSCCVIVYYVFFMMISIPIGNFISISSSNILMIFFAFTFQFLIKLSRKKC